MNSRALSCLTETAEPRESSGTGASSAPAATQHGILERCLDLMQPRAFSSVQEQIELISANVHSSEVVAPHAQVSKNCRRRAGALF